MASSSNNSSPSPTLHDPPPTRTTQHLQSPPAHMSHSSSLFRLKSHTSHASGTPPIPGPSAMEPFASNHEEYGAEKNLREWGEEEMDAEGEGGGAEGIRDSVEGNEPQGSSSVPHEEAKVAEKRLYSHSFFDKELAPLRQIVSKVFFLTCLISICVMWTALPLAWGSLWKAESYTNKLDVRVVNQDDGEIGTFIAKGLLSRTDLGYYSTPSSHFPSNSDIAHEIVEEGSWGAIVINEGVTGALLQARQNGDASYNGSRVIDAYYAQARQENAANEFLVPLLRASLEKLCENFNLNNSGAYISANSGNSTAMALLGQAPSTISNSVWFTMNNVRPYDQTVGTAITLLGLIFLLIFSFIMTLTNNATREIIGPYLTTPSFLLYRLIAPVTLYLPLSFFFSLVDLPFKVHFAAHPQFTYAGGFFLWWFTLFLGMSALGLTTEAVITFLGPRFMPFFLLSFIILNVSITLMPYQLQPWIYKYGLAMPFYHLGRIARTIIFNTKNDIGRSEGVLIGWILVNFVTITVGSYYYRRKAVSAHKQKVAEEKGEKGA
ncbi:hypothetical protein B9479_001779 [Cryptococcus floricola]|uniref:DUF3533 domain-containing protein n=1 Tax=Cryptococcus floricola TaxID=2591691 RepID=A0A5D3B317_9TREE|nr:hypothetical protein B9479_001779 [Cryptococcus floricola]